MKAAQSGVRGVYWRPDVNGSQERKRAGGGRERGEWWVRWTCRLGHLHREQIGAKSRAEKEVEQRRTEARLDDYCPKRVAADRVTISDILKMVVADYEANGRRAIGEVRRYEKRLAPYFGPNRDAADLTAGEIDIYADSRRKGGAAVATVNRELSCLRRGFRLAHQKGRLASIPHVAIAAEHNVRTGFFEEHEFRALQEAADPDMAPLFTFLYLTGWRSGEARSLEWRQVDFSAGMVRLEPGTTKNRDGRTFPFGVLPELHAVLRERRERTRDVERQTGRIIPWVFHRDGEPIGKRGLRLAWCRALKAAKLKDRTPHDCRRTAVRNLERAGVPRSVAMKLTGHKTESVYRRYAIVSEADLAEGLGKLVRLRESGTERVVSLRPMAQA